MASNKIDIFKFPRTRHLFDAGGKGVSRDDLLMDEGEEQLFYSPGPSSKRGGPRKPQQLVAIEEKVDGANLGISIGGDFEIRVQNRSHFVNSKTHKQFSTLGAWVEAHSASLFQILEPERHVLFGEWLYAKHSIYYTGLPGHFMAFDLYDQEVGRFFSWRERNRRLEGTGIPVVRQIAETSLSGRKEVLKWLDTPSAFYDGPCEGIYLRIDEDMPSPTPAGKRQATGSDSTPAPHAQQLPYLKHRSKLVRPDFLQQIEEQWTRQQLTKNIVKY